MVQYLETKKSLVGLFLDRSQNEEPPFRIGTEIGNLQRYVPPHSCIRSNTGRSNALLCSVAFDKSGKIFSCTP